MNLNLLIIEDDQAIVANWKQNLDFYRVESNPIFNIIPTFVDEFFAAEDKLSQMSFDAAVIDIRLKSIDGNPNADGNKLFQSITKSHLTITAVYTGEPEIVEITNDQKEFSKVFEKGNGNIPDILNWLDGKLTLIAAIKNMQISIHQEMAKAFSRSIWPRWSFWLDAQNSELTQKALIRHVASHLHASFLANDELGAHPEEYFFIPPLQENLNTGDIIDDNNNLSIIVTPRCDMQRNKSATSTYQLVTLLDKGDDWRSLEDNLTTQMAADKPKKIESARSAIRKFTNHNNETGSHFIQRFRKEVNGEEKEFGPFYAQFHLLHSIERNPENTKTLLKNRIASLSNEFVPSLVERLGAYFSRIGTPDYSHPE